MSRSDIIKVEPGTKFNHLTFIKEAEPYITPSTGKKITMWVCECDCENHTIITVRSNSVRTGHTKSCGCLQKKKSSEFLKNNHNWNDLTGQQIGYLKVLEQTNQRKFKEIVWKCQCCYKNCNKIVYLTSTEIKNTLSCGNHYFQSLGEEKIATLLTQYNLNFETQKKFNTCLSPITNYPLRFDFYVNNKYLIEYDGEQHYYITGKGWDNEEHFQQTQLYDKIKNEWCKNNNITLIRIPYTKFKTLTIEDLLPEKSQFIVTKY